MPDADKTLKILLQVQSDAAGLTSINKGIDDTAASAEKLGQSAARAGALIGGLIGGGLVSLIREIPNAIEHAADSLVAMTKEIEKQSVQIDKEVQKWLRLAETADKFGDVVKLNDKVAVELAAVAATMASFRSQQLAWWQSWADAVAQSVTSALGFGGPGVRPFGDTLAANQKAAVDQLRNSVRDANVVMDEAKQHSEEWARTLSGPLAIGIGDVQKRISDLQAKAAQLDAQRQVPAGATPEQLVAAQQAIQKLSETNYQLATEKGHLDELHRKWDETFDTQERTVKEGAADTKEFNAELRQESLELQKIRSDLDEIGSNPFLTTDQKSAAFSQLIPQAIRQLNTQIEGNKQILKGSALDPNQYVAVRAAIQRDEVEIAKLNQQLKLTTFSGQFRASLVQWVDSFGTTAQQIAGVITNTIGTAISGVSNAITGAIFHTQSWGQAFAQVAQQIVGNIIQIVLQWAVSRAIMSALNIAFGQTEAQGIAIAGQAATQAWAPAALAASVASYGAAAGAGLIAFIGAETSGTAFAVGLSGASGGFEKGGYTGEAGGVVHRREYVIDAPTVARAGGPQYFDNLRVAINRGGKKDSAPSARSGGGRSSAAPSFKFYSINSPAEMLRMAAQDPEGQHILIDFLHGNAHLLPKR